MNKLNKLSSSARGGCDLAATAQKNGFLPQGYVSSNQQHPTSCLTDLDNDYQLLNTEQLAELMQIKPETIVKARCTRLGDYPNYIKFGRCVRYRKKDVAAWMDGHVQAFGGEML